MAYIKNANIKENTWVGEGAVVVGNVTIGEECGVWYNAVIRGDETSITIGNGTNIQDNCVVHGTTGFPVKIGNGVTVGHACIIHGCEIGNNTLIGMGSTVMNGAKIGKDCIIGAGSLVTQNTVIPDGMLALGRPAKVKRPLTEEEKNANQTNGITYMLLKNVQ